MQELNVASITNYNQLLTAFLQNKSWDAQYRLIIQLGKTLPPLNDELKIETHQVEGCESLAWLVSTEKNGYVYLQMDSETRVVKGLMKIIMLIFQGKTKNEIVAIEEKVLFDELGLLNHLSPSRANGLWAIIKRIKAIVC